MDLDSITGGANVPKTNIVVAELNEALEDKTYDEACSYVGLYASAGDKQFLVERIHYTQLTDDEKRTENIKLYRLLLDEMNKYGIQRNEAELTFSDEYALPEFIKQQHGIELEKPKPFSCLSLLWPYILPS